MSTLAASSNQQRQNENGQTPSFCSATKEPPGPYTNFLDFEDLEGINVETIRNQSNLSNEAATASEASSRITEGSSRMGASTPLNAEKQARRMETKKKQKERSQDQKPYALQLQEKKKKELLNRVESVQTSTPTRETKNSQKKERRQPERRAPIKGKSENPPPSPRSETQTIEKDVEREKKLAVMYSMWQSQDSKKIDSSSLRSASLPTEPPTFVDLSTVIFSPTNSFDLGEIVLVPRTRGGFSYGQITKQMVKSQCFFDPSVQHKSYAWRVVYLSNQRSLFKDLPAPYIGKLKDRPKTNQFLSEPNQDTVPNLPPAIGEKARIKDLQSVVFSSQCKFGADEIVLVPRSAGGFTYGRLAKEVSTNCSLTSTSTHPIRAWRVLVSADSTRKDVAIPSLGKISLLPQASPHPARMAQFQENPESVAPKESELELVKEKSLSVEDVEDEGEEIQWNRQEPPPKPNLTPEAQETQESQATSATVSVDPNKPISEQQISGLIAVDKDKLLKSLMKKKRVLPPEEKRLIVIDGPNVAKKHGKETEFSANGIKIALDYFIDAGHDAIAFLPEHYVKRKPGTGQVTLQEFLPKASNIPLLLELINEGKVVLTPPQDYDDSYCIDYALKRDGCIVTNDRYWDHIDKKKEQLGEKASRERKKWIRDHSISFTFVRDEFLPNPDFKFPPLKDSGIA